MATWVDLDTLSPITLRHIAAAKEAADRPHYDDTDAMATELAAMVMAGTRPTIGWYRRHTSSQPGVTPIGESVPASSPQSDSADS